MNQSVITILLLITFVSAITISNEPNIALGEDFGTIVSEKIDDLPNNSSISEEKGNISSLPVNESSLSIKEVETECKSPCPSSAEMCIEICA